MKLQLLKEDHYRDLFEIVRQVEPFGDRMLFDAFAQLMRAREGFVMLNTAGAVVGHISFGDFIPAVDMRLHASVLPDYQGRWLGRDLLKMAFDYPFTHLELPRLSSYSILGLTDQAGGALEDLGFEIEGWIRRGVRTPEGAYHDVVLYGMLREECRWL